MTNDSVSMFVGVKSGYSGANSAPPSEARSVVGMALGEICRRSGDRQLYSTRPGFVVYDTALKCPVGGEPVAVVMASTKISKASAMAETLREVLEQHTLSLTGAPEEGAETTIGLRIEFENTDLAAVARLWQEKAAAVKQQTITERTPDGIYVSAGVYDDENGKIVVQGEANPRYFAGNEQAWQAAAQQVADAVASELKQHAAVEFRERGFQYLKAQGRKNSRGQKL